MRKAVYSYLQDGVNHSCVVKERSASYQVFDRVKAGVPTHSLHYVSTSEGKTSIHMDLLDPRGTKTGSTPAILRKTEWIEVEGSLVVEFQSSAGELVAFPMANDVEISTHASSINISAKGARILLVEYEGPNR